MSRRSGTGSSTSRSMCVPATYNDRHVALRRRALVRRGRAFFLPLIGPKGAGDRVPVDDLQRPAQDVVVHARTLSKGTLVFHPLLEVLASPERVAGVSKHPSRGVVA